MASGTNVFISYASDAKPMAEELAEVLETQGMNPWVDFKDLHPGQRWKEELERAIDAAQWLVILVGTDSRATPWQEAEWSAALAHTWADHEKRLLPVVFGDSDPPPFLRNWVSLRINPQTESSTWTRHVLDTLRNFRNEAVHGVSARNREERLNRLDEVRKAAEELRKTQSAEPPNLRSE
ncbi:MAG: toll/interleukin-1 receptor domain-containing protein [Bryobacterales bacterium]|nr:toll/interleukin-1 receptor domain-containing protein [Bryobacterales bacterium]